jgi:membrane-associated protease RseP (regulator of RpoE activity)
MRYTSTDTALATIELESGGSATWRLYSGSDGAPSLERVEERTLEVARLGVRVANLDDALAAQLGVPSWEGVHVTTVQGDSAASRAGINTGDVLISVAGRSLSSSEQFSAVVERELAPGRETAVVVRRRTGDAGHADVEFRVTPDAREIVDTQFQSYTLETSRVVRNLTGLQLGLVPADVARGALGTDTPVVLVASVWPGTPAYLAGLRAGDRLLEFDGRSVADVASVEGPVIARGRERGFDVDTTGARTPLVERSGSGPIAVRVSGPLGIHDTQLDVRDDLTMSSDTDIPILFQCDETVSTLNWSLLDFIFQFGANYRRQYLDASTRKPAKSTFFSMLPFGFYEYDATPEGTRYCVLWFIEWTSER